ncbi:MAG: Maf family protein [Candidatus Krumholzibacteria bacterium]|nr:Maf family protein [Candidatus Krumholzibacteria bacterium]
MNPLLPESAQHNLVLASRSPRRIDILRGLNFDFEVLPAEDHVEGGATNNDPFERPVECARLKAQDVARRRPEGLVIGADTVVILDGHMMEKPGDEDEARRFLSSLAGRVHDVVTGLALRKLSTDLDLSAKETTRVHFCELDDDDIQRYIESGEGRDKAASYAVQGLGSALVRSIEGCFYNVVGLPVSLLFDLLKKADS